MFGFEWLGRGNVLPNAMGGARLGILVAFFFSLSAGAASAQIESESQPPPPPHPIPLTTVLVHPNIMGPFGELTVERRVTPWLGFAALGGYGAARNLLDPFPMFELGAQARLHYSRPVGTTRLSDVGLGAQFAYKHARDSEPISMDPFQTPPGLAATPFVFAGGSIGGFTMTFETGFAFMLIA